MDRIQLMVLAVAKESFYDNDIQKEGGKGAPKGNGKGYGDRGTKKPFEQRNIDQRDNRPDVRLR